jgi:hypothetical protein
MKKKAVFVLIFSCIAGSLFCQTASDYFPAQEGYRWDYIGSNGQVTARYMCVLVQKISDNDSGVGFFQEYLGITTRVIYDVVEDTGVSEVGMIDAFDNTLQHKNRPIILSLSVMNWQEEDRGDIFQCRSRKTSVSFDGKTYGDCIMVEKAIFLDDGSFLMVKRQYFARGIGLVYVTLQDENDSVEKPFLRLSSHNF